MNNFFKNFFTKETAASILKGALTLTASHYTTKGVQTGVEFAANKIRGTRPQKRNGSDVIDAEETTPNFSKD